MTKNPSRKLLKVFVLIIPQVIRIHIIEWKACCPRTARGMEIYVLIIFQVIRIHFSEWEVILALVVSGPRRGVKFK
jgi:hypothetical protein